MRIPASRASALQAQSVSYPGGTEHIQAVRADLRRLLDGCPMADDVILCASELAANAAIHSRSGLPGGAFTVQTKTSPGCYVWITVEDAGGPWSPPASNPSRPHGLNIVRELATEYGVYGDHRARTIWARFAWPDAAVSGHYPLCDT
jgi:serine/threonine-protein kinase RsbW